MNCFKKSLLGVVLILLGACETATTGESTGTLSAALSIDDLLTSSYELKALIKPDKMPMAENGALVDGNRFFFIANKVIYEGILQPDGTFQYETVVQTKNCNFLGLTAHDSLLYGACSITSEGTAKLFRVDLSLDESHPQRVASARLYGSGFTPNGMAVDDRGDIFMSNAAGTAMARPTSERPAVIRVRVVDEENFTIKKKAVVPTGGVNGFEPNGLQIQGDRLWLACGIYLYEAEIVNSGLKDMHVIFRTQSGRFLDDFAILPENIIAIAEIPFPFSMRSILHSIFPNLYSWPPKNQPSKLRFISTGPGPYSNKAGELIDEYIFDDPLIAPSSATLMEDEDGPAFYITDVMLGGVYLMRPVTE